MTMTPKQLLIPGKTNQNAPPGYAQDMRTLEMFNPINKLIAGSGVTLNPADGSGPQVEISAAGGGGGASIGVFMIGGGPDGLGDNTTQNGGAFLSPAQAISFGALGQFGTYLAAPAGTVAGAFAWVGGGWVISTTPGASAALLPFFQAPLFTGTPTISVSLKMGALSADNQQQTRWSAGPFALTSGEMYQTLDTDWSNDFYNAGVATLTMTPGSGVSGNGLVDSASNLWFASYFGIVTIGGVTAFT